MTRALTTPPPSLAAIGAAQAEDRVALLAEVDFKWLMAGQGWWIDSQRLHADPSYHANLLRLALQSPCSALRECATFLEALAMAQAQRTVAGSTLPA